MAVEISDLEKKIIRQVEYYFGNHNLPRDKFLQEQIKTEDGWVTLETMTKFNKLKELTADVKVIAAAMKKATSGLMEVNEDETKLRRRSDKPIPENTEDNRQDVNNRTVYAKAFPLDLTLEKIQNFFDTFGPFEHIQMRKDVKRKFKGSVFVTFSTKESVEKFLSAESVKYNDVELVKRLRKSDYFKEKGEEKKKQQEDRQKKKNDASNRQHKDEERNFENDMTKGALLHLKGFADKSTREDIKNLLQDFGPIAWVDFNKGDTEGWVRYDQENKAKDVLEKLLAANDNTITLNGATLEGRVLEGEEEAERWKKMFKDIKERVTGKQRRAMKGKPRFGKRPCKNKRQAAKRAAAGLDDDDGAGGDDNDADDGDVDVSEAKKSKLDTEANGD